MKKIYFVLLLLPILISSCVRDTTMSADEKHIVVECILSCDVQQVLHLNFTVPESALISPVPEAKAVLTDQQTGKEIGQFVKGEKDLWTLDYAAEPLHKYRLDIDVPGYEHVFAEQTMPEQVDVQGRYTEGGTWSSNLDLLKFGNEGFKGTVFQAYSLPAHTWICGLNTNKTTGEVEIADEILTDFPYIDNFNLTGEVFDPAHETIGSYNYLNGLPKHRQYLRTTHQVAAAKKMGDQTSMEEINSSTFILHGSFFEDPALSYRYYYETRLAVGNVLFTATSEDYDKYLSESVHYQQLQESSDMTSIYIRDNIFSNINGGIGIFGARTECTCDCLYPAPITDGPNPAGTLTE